MTRQDIKYIYHNAPPLWDWRLGDPSVHENSKEANDAYARYLQRRGITEAELERELGEWLDAQD